MTGQHITNHESLDLMDRRLAEARDAFSADPTPEASVAVQIAATRLANWHREIASLEKEFGPWVYGPPLPTTKYTTEQLAAAGYIGIFKVIK